MKTGTLSTLAPRSFQRALCLCLALVMLFSLVAFVPSRTALAAPGDWVHSFISGEMAKKYGKYNNVSGLPAKFANYAQTQDNQFYHSTLDYHAIYCIEIDQHAWYANPDESDTSPLFPGTNTEKQRMLAYALANGQRFFGEDEASVKLYTATQIAVWVIAEGHLGDGTDLDLILYSASGTPPAGTAFAPTLEVGRLARQLLEGAQTFAAGAADISTLLAPIIPSFMSLDESSAQTFPLKNVGTAYETEIVDSNGVVGRDWPKLLKVVDSAGLIVREGLAESSLSVRGTPRQETTVKLTGPYGGYKLSYLSTTAKQAGGEPFQNMTRLARLDGEIPLYFKVTADGSGPTTRVTGLDLQKLVRGDGDLAKEFKFTAHFKTESGDDATGILLNGADFKSGSTLTLKHGAMAHFTQIPVGSTYEIVESDYSADGYTSDKPNNTVKGVTAAAEIRLESFLNTYKAPSSLNDNGKGTKTSLPRTGDAILPASVALAMALSGLAIIGFWLRRRYLRHNKR